MSSSSNTVGDEVELNHKKTWERRMDEAKRKHRPKLKNWSRDGFAFHRDEAFQGTKVLAQTDVCPIYQIDQFDASAMDKTLFVKLIEEKCKPCLIANIPTHENWVDPSAWTISSLNRRFKDRYFKVGEDDDGYKVKARLKYFIDYMKYNKDDSPLYIFDGNFDEDGVSKSLLHNYKVPSYFTDDLFSLVGEDRRPPYRWVLLGPERSGSSVHIDPLATSAWNTVLVGRKRWVLFPPETPKSVAKGLDVILKGTQFCVMQCNVYTMLWCERFVVHRSVGPCLCGCLNSKYFDSMYCLSCLCILACVFFRFLRVRSGEDDEAINYFVDMLPRIRAKHGHSIKIYEFIQHPGETVFVPGGWWHGVLNLEDTVAVTQVYA
jgi:hypothetical protein